MGKQGYIYIYIFIEEIRMRIFEFKPSLVFDSSEYWNDYPVAFKRR